jgi:periplasmic protein TonB
MTSQTSAANLNIVNLFAGRTPQQRPAEQLSVQPNKRELDGLPLQVTQQDTEKKSSSWIVVFFVITLHALAIYILSAPKPLEKIEAFQAKPMMVSIIAPPSPEPEILPIIEPPKPDPKPVVKNKPKPKKVVEKILPIEKPVEHLVEATTEPPKEEEIIKPEAAPVLVSEPPKAPPKTVPIVEEKYEEPRFGVSYLNNPAPDYPAMSRRLGEEGRVLMKVLVSAEGAAEDVQIEKSSGSDRLDNAAISAVKRWRFIPAKRNNQPLSAYVLVPMKFSLDN